MDTALARLTLLYTPFPLIVEEIVQRPVEYSTRPTVIDEVAGLLVTSLAPSDLPVIN
jgi:hypothetical protein